jgi:hypothetical protein
MSLTAAIEISAGQANAVEFRITLRITNPTDKTIAILNPDMGVPSAAAHWRYSNEAYRIFLLMSFGFLSMSVVDEEGREAPRQEVLMSATPALRPPIDLARGESIDVEIPVGSLYLLESGKEYMVALEYGDQDLKVSAQGRFTSP